MPAGSPVRKPLLGLILLREGLLDEATLARAISVWDARRREVGYVPFGQVVLALGLCDASTLGPYLALQRKLAVAPGRRKPLGHLLIENAVLTPTQVAIALQLQRATGQPLGALLVEEEVLREPQLEVLLRFQAREAHAA
ncbi:MAG: hypothetical protein VKQ33_02330 [Candidatus Sericytochromatia bacterium]|nr:hypothetical protein [Candidatus Sericytochromatia bacterium]